MHRADTLFDRIDTWLFDLDNTLYPPSCRIFDRIDERMGQFITTLLGCDAAEARHIQKRYFHDHGTTLAGLVRHHGVCPHSFLDFVHDVDLAALDEAPRLADALTALPGRRIVFTNGDAPYAQRVLERLGLAAGWDGVHDIHATGLIPKPEIAAYDSLVSRFGLDPARTAFVEDMARNLVPAKALGMTTIWLDCGSEAGARGIMPDHIDFTISDLAAWLGGGQAAKQEERAA